MVTASRPSSSTDIDMSYEQLSGSPSSGPYPPPGIQGLWLLPINEQMRGNPSGLFLENLEMEPEQPLDLQNWYNFTPALRSTQVQVQRQYGTVGSYFTTTLALSLSIHTPESVERMKELENDRVLAILLDMGGQYWLAGWRQGLRCIQLELDSSQAVAQVQLQHYGTNSVYAVQPNIVTILPAAPCENVPNLNWIDSHVLLESIADCLLLEP